MAHKKSRCNWKHGIHKGSGKIITLAYHESITRCVQDKMEMWNCELQAAQAGDYIANLMALGFPTKNQSKLESTKSSAGFSFGLTLKYVRDFKPLEVA